jgi:DnaJ-class molecular chaperone
MSRDDVVRAESVAKAAEKPGYDVCPDCDGTGWHYSNDWPTKRDRVTCYRCRGEGIARPRASQ